MEQEFALRRGGVHLLGQQALRMSRGMGDKRFRNVP